MTPELRARIADKAAQLQQRFLQVGAQAVDVATLLPAERLLDVYGEDIRARAYVTQDSVWGEQMLRPDFTVPIAEYHLADSNNSGAARYCYNGLVWRKQMGDSARPREFRQVGIELFATPNPAQAEAEVFALFFDILKTEVTNLSVIIGDIGLLRAAIMGLDTSPARRTALLRHLWHPQRFRQLLDRFSGKAAPLTSRANLIKQIAKQDFNTVLKQAGKPIGLRSKDAIKARVDWLIEESKTPNLSKSEAALIDSILTLNTSAESALQQVQDWAKKHPCLTEAAERLTARLTAFTEQGIALDTLKFEGSYGLTSLEYYDGFVFGFTDGGQNILATGGRYDALAEHLGGQKLTAIGGVIRPDILLQATGG